MGYDKLSIRELGREKRKISSYVKKGKSEDWIRSRILDMFQDGKISANEAMILTDCVSFEIKEQNND
jgi:hypothetical protein